LSSDWYLRSRLFGYGRTTFSLTNPEHTLAVGSEDDKTVEDEMLEPDD